MTFAIIFIAAIFTQSLALLFAVGLQSANKTEHPGAISVILFLMAACAMLGSGLFYLAGSL